MSIKRVQGKVDFAGVDAEGNAVSRIRLTNTTPEKVKEMFLKEDPKEFFPTAHAYLRTPTDTGGQRMFENPKMPGPIMAVDIEPAPNGPHGELFVKSTFEGFIVGGATLKIYRDTNGDTIIDEKTACRPNAPGVGMALDLAAKVPFFGAFARVGHAMMDSMAAASGVFLAALHAHEVPKGAITAIEETLTRKNG